MDKKLKTRLKSVTAVILAFVWALLVVCSDDILVYAGCEFENLEQLSSFISGSNDSLAESNTDFLLQEQNCLRGGMRHSRHFAKTKLLYSEMQEGKYLLNFIQDKKYIILLEIDEFFNEKIIIEYIHRQDGDK